MKILFLLMFLTSCAGLKDWTKDVFEPTSNMDDVQETHKPLDQQRLIPRPGYEGHLTNRICTKWYGDKCEGESIKPYSLKDKKVREMLIEMDFACRISGKRYRICPEEEGFCRKEKHTECKKWGKKVFSRKRICRRWKDDVVIEKFISIDDYQYLLDGSTECKKGM